MESSATAVVEQRESITRAQFVERVRGLKGAQFVSLLTRTDVKMPKTGNPFAGRVEKISKISGMIGFSYENSVNAAREKVGNTDEFIAGPRLWGTRIEGTALVEHKGQYYVEVKIDRSMEPPTFLLDGAPPTMEQQEELKPWLPEHKAVTEIVVRTYKVESVIWFNGGGHKFSVQG